ncbi:MAG: hypothetical protein ACTSPI_02360 [Candidatus Heimdallarchaeaceae archaeon]
MDISKLKQWKLFRAVYFYDGLGFIEGEESEDWFEKALAKNPAGASHVIGIPHDCDGHTHVELILEGKKENLEFVLELVARFLKVEND